HRCSGHGGSVRCSDRQPTHRSYATCSGRPAQCATTSRATGWLALRDGSAVAHQPLSVRPASDTRVLLRPRSLAAGIWRSGKAAHGEARRLCPHERPSAVVSVYTAPRGVSDRRVCLRSFDRRASRETSVQSSRAAWVRGVERWGAVFLGGGACCAGILI